MAEYRIMDVEDYYRYSDMLCIKVLDLTQIEAASRDKNANPNLICWARIFKAKTMEELEYLTKGEEVFEDMIYTLKELSEDKKIRMQCEAREDYERCLLSEYNSGKKDGISQGISQGIRQERALTIKRMMKAGISIEQIMACGYTEEEIKKAKE